MFQLKSWQGIYGRIQADIDASHRGHSSTPLTRGGLAHCWLITSPLSVYFGEVWCKATFLNPALPPSSMVRGSLRSRTYRRIYVLVPSRTIIRYKKRKPKQQ